MLQCRKYGLRVAVLNDFEAAGYGITVLSENDYVALNAVPAAPQACSSPARMCQFCQQKSLSKNSTSFPATMCHFLLSGSRCPLWQS